MTTFYVIEAILQQGFLDPVGPADLGWLTTPMLALSEVEAGVSTTTTLRASDVGYRSRASDPQGVQAYPPRVLDAFSVDVSLNLDPTASSVGAAWGSITLANTDGFFDSLVASTQSDGQPITIYRGEKQFDAARGFAVDPAWSSLQQVFAGVLGRFQVAPEKITIPLTDATNYLTKTLPRTLYGGTGGKDGTSDLAGVAMPYAVGGSTSLGLLNVSPQPVDLPDLVYQFAAGISFNPFFFVEAVWDGGVNLVNALGGITFADDVYGVAPPGPGFYVYDSSGYLRVGSTPVYGLTGFLLAAMTTVDLVHSLLTAQDQFAIPANLVSDDGSGNILAVGVNATATAAAMALQVGMVLGSSESVDGITLISRLLASTGAQLVPGRDGKLRLFVLAEVPSTAVPVVSFDDTNIVSVTPQPLPASIDPPPRRMRIAYARNWTIQSATNVAASVQGTWLTRTSQPAVIAVGIPAALSNADSARSNDPPVIGLDGGCVDFDAGRAGAVVQNMAAFWGKQRRLLEVVCPASVGLALDWGSVVKVTSRFDGFDSGRLGQIVGWRYGSGDASATFRVIV